MIGILGAGQLARMLRQASLRLEERFSNGVEAGAPERWEGPVAVYGSSANEPALRLPGPQVIGTSGNLDRLREFFTGHSPVLFESEFWDLGILRSAARGLAVQFVPSLEVLAKVQDKLEQKKMFQQLGLRTPPYVAYQNQPRVSEWLTDQWTHFGGPFVLKWARMGYDGKGTFFFNSYKDHREAEAFVRQAVRQGYPVYAEKKIRFVRELAMVACYSTNKKFLNYPLVISEQASGICHWVKGPAVGLGVAKSLEVEAAKGCEKVAKELDLFGAFALEFFETEDGGLWVNELAPRVHNTGHYSQDACRVSQFENHLLACSGRDPQAPDVKGFFIMLNLIGGPGADVELTEKPGFEPVPEGCRLEWYSKSQLRAGRKMGHINAVVDSAEEVQKKVLELQGWEVRWHAFLEQMRGEGHG